MLNFNPNSCFPLAELLPAHGSCNQVSVKYWILLLIIAATIPSMSSSGHSSMSAGRDTSTTMPRQKFLVLESPPLGTTNEISNSLTTFPATLAATTVTSTVTSSSGSRSLVSTQSSDQKQYPSLDKVAKAKLVSSDMSESDSVDDNLLELYNTPMYFGTENSSMVTVQAGAVAHLPCTIHHIGEGVVSWLRRKDETYHLLTVALTTYSSDERFTTIHLSHSEDWTLQIKFVQTRDSGIYECQVSTHPPSSIFVHLNVVEARAEIVGPTVKYLTPGSTLKLICRVVQSTENPAFIFWYHNNRMINYDVDRGINVSAEADFHYSELTIAHANKEHSGNYTCVPQNSQPASTIVHIFKGDHPAAMYHEHRSSATRPYRDCRRYTITMFIYSTVSVFATNLLLPFIFTVCSLYSLTGSNRRCRCRRHSQFGGTITTTSTITSTTTNIKLAHDDDSCCYYSPSGSIR